MNNPWIYPEQVSLIALEALSSGLPVEYLNILVKAAEKGYLLGYADRTIGRSHNTTMYDPQEIIEGLIGRSRKSD